MRKVCLFVAFIDMEKAYDIVDRKTRFDVLRAYGVHDKLVSLIERVLTYLMCYRCIRGTICL